MTGSMRLVCEFLKRGANPNFYVNDFSATIWGEFLLKFEYLYPHDKSACAEITKVFVDHGANVHEIIYTEHLHVVHDISLLRGHAEWDPSLVQNFRTRHERTALYIFQESLSGTPDFEALENACQSKGAYSSSRATHIALTDENGYFRSYKMTDLQFSRFEAAFEIFDHFWRFWPRTRYQTAESIRLHLSHARQIARIWKEITKDADFDCQNNSDGEPVSDSAADFHSTSSRISLPPQCKRAIALRMAGPPEV